MLWLTIGALIISIAALIVATLALLNAGPTLRLRAHVYKGRYTVEITNRGNSDVTITRISVGEFRCKWSGPELPYRMPGNSEMFWHAVADPSVPENIRALYTNMFVTAGGRLLMRRISGRSK